MATNIPPHNLREVIGAVVALIDDPAIDTAGLMQHIKGPDFPTAGIILGRQGILDAYETGRGRVRVRAKAHTEDIGRGKEAIIVTELPYMVKKGGDNGLVKKIADLVHEKRLTGIANLEDQSDRRGMRLVIELKRDAIPEVVLNQLYKHTPMQTTFGVNMVALVDNVPRTLPLRARPRRLRPAPARGHRPAVQARARRPRAPRARPRGPAHRAGQPRRGHRDDPRLARPRRRPRRSSSSASASPTIQASAILDLRLSQLTALEAGTLRTEHADKLERIARAARASSATSSASSGSSRRSCWRSPSASATSGARSSPTPRTRSTSRT